MVSLEKCTSLWEFIYTNLCFVGFGFNYGWCIQFFLVFFLIKSCCFSNWSCLLFEDHFTFISIKRDDTRLFYHACYIPFLLWSILPLGHGEDGLCGLSNLNCCEWLVFWCLLVIRLWWIKVLVAHFAQFLRNLWLDMDESAAWSQFDLLCISHSLCYTLNIPSL